MDFDLDSSERLLREAVREFCADKCTSDAVRAFGAPGGFDRKLWDGLEQLGILNLLRSEADGGTGATPIEAAVVFHELGRTVAPGPILATVLARSLVEVDTATWVQRCMQPLLVEHLEDADLLFISDASGITTVEPRRLDSVEVAALDPTSRLYSVASLPEGSPVADAAAAEHLHTVGNVLTSASLVGIAGRTVELGVEFAQGREQFNRPIGSFQAVKHMLADAYARAQVAEAAMYAAAVRLAESLDANEVQRAVAAARYLSYTAAVDNAKTCIQVMGGMGFTWEMDAHLYLKRAWASQDRHGNPEAALRTIADQLAPENRTTT
ncbi:MAG TPA: acyl-CoA dehydrogenase family protein [Jatrophihabitans sp.]